MDDWGYWLSHESEVNAAIVTSLQLAIAVVVLVAARAAVRHRVLLPDVIAVLGTSLAVRMAVPATMRHENQHGFMYFTDVACAEPVRDTYGFGWFALQVPAMRALGATFETMFLVQTVASVLVPVAALAWVRSLGLSRAAGLAAGLLVALSVPLALTGRSQDMLGVALLWLFTGLTLGVRGARTGDVLDGVGAACALAVGAQTRPELWVVAPVSLVVSVVCVEGAAKSAIGHARRLVPGLVTGVALVTVPLHNFVWKLLHGEQDSAHVLGDRAGAMSDHLLQGTLADGRTGNVMLVSAWVSPLMLVGLAGVALSARPGQRGALAPWLMQLGTSVLWIATSDTPMAAMRLQTVPIALLAVLAGITIAEHAGRWAGARVWVQAVVVSAFVVGVGAHTVTHLVDPLAGTNTSREVAVLTRTLPQLPDGATVVTPRSDHVVNAFFPACHQALTDRGITVVPAVDPAALPTGPGPVLFWQGTNCWAFARPEDATGRTQRSECEAVRASCPDPVPGQTDTFPSRPADFLHVPATELTLGFYACAPASPPGP